MTTAKKLMTAEELLMLPDNGRRYELVKGELIEMPPPGVMHGAVVVNRDDDAVQRFGVNDTLTADPVLPGFTCLVADIFAY